MSKQASYQFYSSISMEPITVFFLHLFLLPDHIVGKLWIPLGCLEDVVGPVHQGVPVMIVCVLSHINFIIPGSLSEFTVQRDAPVWEIPLRSFLLQVWYAEGCSWATQVS